MINRTTKTKWLNALRSNKYRKTTGAMRRGGRYDALGVLCDVTGNTKNRRMTAAYPRVNKDGDVQSFMGLSPNIQQKISQLNDGSNDFDSVIRYISRNVKAVG